MLILGWNKIYVNTGYILVSRNEKKIKACCAKDDIPDKYISKIKHQYKVDGVIYYLSFEDEDFKWSVKKTYVKYS